MFIFLVIIVFYAATNENNMRFNKLKRQGFDSNVFLYLTNDGYNIPLLTQKLEILQNKMEGINNLYQLKKEEKQIIRDCFRFTSKFFILYVEGYGCTMFSEEFLGLINCFFELVSIQMGRSISNQIKSLVTNKNNVIIAINKSLKNVKMLELNSKIKLNDIYCSKRLRMMIYKALKYIKATQIILYYYCYYKLTDYFMKIPFRRCILSHEIINKYSQHNKICFNIINDNYMSKFEIIKEREKKIYKYLMKGTRNDDFYYNCLSFYIEYEILNDYIISLGENSPINYFSIQENYVMCEKIKEIKEFLNKNSSLYGKKYFLKDNNNFINAFIKKRDEFVSVIDKLMINHFILMNDTISNVISNVKNNSCNQIYRIKIFKSIVEIILNHLIHLEYLFELTNEHFFAGKYFNIFVSKEHETSEIGYFYKNDVKNLLIVINKYKNMHESIEFPSYLELLKCYSVFNYDRLLIALEGETYFKTMCDDFMKYSAEEHQKIEDLYFIKKEEDEYDE